MKKLSIAFAIFAKYFEKYDFPDIENVGSEYKESFINNFRKAMEE